MIDGAVTKNIRAHKSILVHKSISLLFSDSSLEVDFWKYNYQVKERTTFLALALYYILSGIA